MTNLLKLGLPFVFALAFTSGCDDDDGESSSTGASSGTTGDMGTSGGDTGIATTPPTTGDDDSGDTGIATTPPMTGSSEDTGIATTPPGTDSSGSSATGDEDGAVVEVTYAFVAELAGVPLDCVSADASLVDVYVVASDDPERAMWDLQDLPCDDTAIEVGPLPPGAYELQVVAWSPALWEGSSGVIDLGLDASTVSIDLVEVPKR